MAKRFANAGVEAQINKPEAFATMIAQEIPMGQKVEKAANIRVG